MPKRLETLSKEDSIVFYDISYRQIITANPTTIFADGKIFVQYTPKEREPTSQTLRSQDILAIRNDDSGAETIPALDGKYDVLHGEKLKRYMQISKGD